MPVEVPPLPLGSGPRPPGPGGCGCPGDFSFRAAWVVLVVGGLQVAWQPASAASAARQTPLECLHLRTTLVNPRRLREIPEP